MNGQKIYDNWNFTFCLSFCMCVLCRHVRMTSVTVNVKSTFNLFLLKTIIQSREINIMKTAAHTSIIICFFSWLLFIIASYFPSTF